MGAHDHSGGGLARVRAYAGSFRVTARLVHREPPGRRLDGGGGRDRLAYTFQVSQVTSGSGTQLETWAKAAFDLLAELPAVHRVGLALVEAGGRRLSFTASDRKHEQGADSCEVDAYDDVPLNNTIRTGRVIAGSLDELAGRYPDFIGRQSGSTQALATVPLTAAGQIVGGFAAFYETAQPFGDAQVKQLMKQGETLGAELRRSQRAATLTDRALTHEFILDGGRVADHLVPPDPAEISVARQFMRRTLSAWGIHEDIQDTAVLCLSELVTNAVIHTPAGCGVVLLHRSDVLTISVRDSGTATHALNDPGADPLAVQGRGLRLVDAIAARWGSSSDESGTTVSCELATPSRIANR
jgi:anti-sigma regulatory factor (Ser/Thr protein kinase)